MAGLASAQYSSTGAMLLSYTWTATTVAAAGLSPWGHSLAANCGSWILAVRSSFTTTCLCPWPGHWKDIRRLKLGIWSMARSTTSRSDSFALTAECLMLWCLSMEHGFLWFSFAEGAASKSMRRAAAKHNWTIAMLLLYGEDYISII